jgi:hypothetical protein
MQLSLLFSPGSHPPRAGHQTCSDHTFGPFVDCRFDFTLQFEQLVFCSLHSLVLILLAPWAIASLRLETKKTVPSWVYAAKEVRALMYIIGSSILIISSVSRLPCLYRNWLFYGYGR